MIAETRVGRGEKALDYYHRINPSVREEISDVHRCEPYVYAQMISGKEAVKKGEDKNSWLTGTAAWNYVAITQWILGIRPGYEGLILAPVIPDSWQGFKARRYFRGSYYNIEVRREGPGNHRRLMMDGKEIDGDQLPLPASGKTDVEVQVILG
jgi:cellobiose phosphorylase